MCDLPAPKLLQLSKITGEDIVRLMKVVRVLDVSSEAKLKMWDLARMVPEKRLALNCMIVAGICAKHKVTTITGDGITAEERRVLLELEFSGIKDSILKVAHSLMNLKERWFFVKAMKASFRREKGSGNFITLTQEESLNGDTDK